MHPILPPLALALFALLALVPARTAEEPRNLIVILIDDQGYYDLGCYGATEAQLKTS